MKIALPCAASPLTLFAAMPEALGAPMLVLVAAAGLFPEQAPNIVIPQTAKKNSAEDRAIT